jgi:hypothetical protein
VIDYVSTGEKWGLSHGGIRTDGCIGNCALPERSGRWKRTIGEVSPLSGKAVNKFVVVIPIRRSKERKQ